MLPNKSSCACFVILHTLCTHQLQFIFSLGVSRYFILLSVTPTAYIFIPINIQAFSNRQVCKYLKIISRLTRKSNFAYENFVSISFKHIHFCFNVHLTFLRFELYHELFEFYLFRGMCVAILCNGFEKNVIVSSPLQNAP